MFSQNIGTHLPDWFIVQKIITITSSNIYTNCMLIKVGNTVEEVAVQCCVINVCELLFILKHLNVTQKPAVLELSTHKCAISVSI
jgi:hypothetical protein